MAIVVLLRHGRTQANVDGLLAGWTAGIGLDEVGREQAVRVGRRLAQTPLTRLVTSPLQRCQETAQSVLDERPAGDALLRSEASDLGEAKYGAWTGKPLKELAQDPLWKDVQSRPSTVTFPPDEQHEHESMARMQQRAVEVVHRIDAEVEEQHGPGAVWAVVSHGDVLKAILANALATPLDEFQRITVDPSSISIVRYTAQRAFVLRTNDTSGDPVDLRAVSKAAKPDDDAAVGGGAGTD